MFTAIEHVVYINLDHRTDRRKHVEEQLGRVFSADKIQRFAAIKDSNGGKGCMKSHLAVLELAKENGWSNVLVVEDDFTWNNFDKGAPILERFLANPYDVIMFCGTYVQAEDDGRLLSAQTATAYVVAQSYYDTLIANYREAIDLYTRTGDWTKYANDQYWKRLQPRGRWYIVRPNMGFQLPSYSDIEGRNVNYLRYFK